MVIPVQVVNNALPQLSVTIPNGGTNPVTYSEVRASMGSYVYKVEGLYLYSDNPNQLITIIKYNRFDVNGEEKTTNIVTTLDPYQMESSLFKDLTPMQVAFILNGNSSMSATILPLSYLQLKLYCTRITNSFDGNLDNFKEMEIIANKPYFFDNYGNRRVTEQVNNQVEGLQPAEAKFEYGAMGDFTVQGSAMTERDDLYNYQYAQVGQIAAQGHGEQADAALANTPALVQATSGVTHADKTVLVLSVAALTAGIYLLTKKD